MEILDKTQDILDYVNKSISNENNNIELEVIIGSNSRQPKLINKSIFLKLLNKLKEDYGDTLNVSVNLDIRKKVGNNTSNIRCSILNLESIKKYCITNSLENLNSDSVHIIQKEDFKDKDIVQSKIFNNEYNYRLNLKSEDEDNNIDRIKKYNLDINDKLKHYRYKKRYSFITNDKLFRIDLSVVKSTKYKNNSYNFAKTFKEANILNNPEEYELEIEYIGSTYTKDNGVYYINDYYNKLTLDIENPVSITGNLSNPLSLDTPSSLPDDKSDLSLMPDILTNQSSLSVDLKDKLIGKNIKIKDTYELKDIDYTDSDLITIIDYDNDYDSNGKHVQVQILSNKIWIPLTEIYSAHFDIDELLLDKYNKKGGGKTDDDKKLNFNIEKLELLSNKFIELLNDHIRYILEIIHNTKLLLTLSQKNTIINRYKLLTKQPKDKYAKFIGPQPITLNHENLLLSNDINILKGYAVTEKADGIRCLLFITENTGYLITSKMEIIPTGLKFPKIDGEWLLDGEYITKNKNGYDLDKNLYMIFDIYNNGNPKDTKPIHMYKWIDEDDKKPSRLNELIKFKELIQEQIQSDIDYIKIGIKEYEYGSINITDEDSDKHYKDINEIFNKCKLILDKTDSFEYYIDGLILMPTYLGVKGSKLEPSPSFIGGAWSYNFKWKPPEENTIDFKVSTIKISSDSKQDKIFPFEDENGILQKYKKLNIINGYKEEEDISLEFWMKILTGDKPSKENTKIFTPPNTKENVSTTNIILQDNKMLCLKGGDEIKDGDIVEMRYNPDGLNGMIWEPLRVRSDKLIPNFKSTADNVWETIIKPISTDFISGVEKYNEKKIMKNVKKNVDTGYYVSSNRSNETYILTKLHNYIKTTLINGICSIFKKNIQYMDLSCGRGGDVDRYINPNNKIKFVLGLDIEDINEASRRYFYKNPKNKGVFLQYDTSKNIKSKEQEDINKHSKVMIDILYGLSKTVPVQYKQVYNDYKRIAKNKFQVISSQFTLHYYLRSEETFNGFLTNISENIDKGGYFIATFYNGNKLYELLKDKENIEYINKLGDKVYKISKKYDNDNFVYDNNDTSNMFGNTISVYMDSIGQEIDEYLVNMDFLIDSFKKIDMELVRPTSKLNIFNKSNFEIDGVGSFEKIINNINSMSKSDKLLKSTYKDSLKILKDENLKLLSGLNVYVIFQKK